MPILGTSTTVRSAMRLEYRSKCCLERLAGLKVEREPRSILLVIGSKMRHMVTIQRTKYKFEMESTSQNEMDIEHEILNVPDQHGAYRLPANPSRT